MTPPNENWRHFFDDWKDRVIVGVNDESAQTTTMEEMYEMFEARREWEEDQRHD